jgi:predicted amidophosphoribosyltransferase
MTKDDSFFCGNCGEFYDKQPGVCDVCGRNQFTKTPMVSPPEICYAPNTKITTRIIANGCEPFDSLLQECDVSAEVLLNNALTLLKWSIGKIKNNEAIGSLDNKSNIFTEYGSAILDKFKTEKPNELVER